MRFTASRFAGALFLIGGVAIVFVRGPLASTTWFAFGASFILMDPPLRTSREGRRRSRPRLPPRNVAALIAAAMAIGFLVLQVTRGA